MAPHSNLDALLAELNPEQRAAATHKDRPLLIVAGAGTGKTTTLAHRVAYQIVQGVHPSRILLLTFSRRAAGEMLRRVAALLRRLDRAADEKKLIERLWGGTFHAVSARLLRLHGSAIGLEPDSTIYDRADSEDLMNLVRNELGLGQKERRFPTKATALAIYSRVVNTRQRLEAVLGSAFPWCQQEAADLKRLFGAYVDRKQAHNILDYDDLLLFWHALLETPEGDALRGRFDRVLVDEYQDTSVLQAEILAALRPGGHGLTAVGDDAQAIYGFRAATVRNILEFPQTFPGAAVVTLVTNYRSTPPLVAVSNAVIAQASERHDKALVAHRSGGSRPVLVTCSDEEEQTEFAIARILEHREQGIALRKQAVLFRAAHHSLGLELELGRRNVPFHKYGGLKFVEAAHIKDLVAFLRLVENPRDEVSALRVLLLLPGMGPAHARRLLGELPATSGQFSSWLEHRPKSSDPALWQEFVTLLGELASPQAPEVPLQIHRIAALWSRLVETRYDNLTVRLRDLEQLEHIASRHPERGAFLAELTLDPPSSTQDLAGPPHLDDDYLVLSTIHSAKGLEFDCVHVLHAADGNIPSDMATGSAAEIDEELRLFYVALTRARDHLYIHFPQRYYRPGRIDDLHTYAQLTRFLPPQVAALLDQQLARPGRSSSTPKGRAQTPANRAHAAEVRANLRRLWS